MELRPRQAGGTRLPLQWEHGNTQPVGAAHWGRDSQILNQTLQNYENRFLGPWLRIWVWKVCTGRLHSGQTLIHQEVLEKLIEFGVWARIPNIQRSTWSFVQNPQGSKIYLNPDPPKFRTRPQWAQVRVAQSPKNFQVLGLSVVEPH